MAGADVNPHQSKQVLNHHAPDDLVFDWKIYHLHLSTTRTVGKYFVDRTKELLFIYLDQERAIFLDIFEHKPTDFSKIQLLEILDKTDSKILMVANEIVGLSHELTDEERLKLRKGNVNEGILKVNDKFVFSPNMGRVSNGQSLDSVMKAMALLNWAKQNMDNINKDLAGASAYFNTRFGLKGNIAFGLEVTNAGPAIIDRNSRQRLIKWQVVYKPGSN
jgi:hypothetical protein